MRPLPHRLRGILRQQAAAHEQPQHAPAHLRLHLMVWAMALASIPAAEWKVTPPAVADANTPSMITP
jgi:hypothetical protein